ncbi:MAG: hypothetical protein ACPG4Z_04730 [Chitinophagales bacterium]
MIVKAFFCNDLLHQYQNTPFHFSGIDNTFWFFHLLQLPQFITVNFWAAISFEIVICIIALFCIQFSQKKLFSVLFFLLYLLYYIAFDSSQAKHNHLNIGLLLMSFVFCFKKDKNIQLLWEGLRYYLLFIFVSAAFWKISRAAIFEIEHMSSILTNQHIYILLQKPQSFYAQFLSFLIENVWLSQSLFVIATILELILIVGFFIKKYDKALFFIICLFLVSNYFLMSINYIELSIMLLTFIPLSSFKKE